MNQKIKLAAHAALSAIERGESMDHLTQNIVPMLRDALYPSPKLSLEQRKVLAILKEGPRRFTELLADLSMTKATAQRTVAQLHDRKLIHIQSYIVGLGPASRVWAFGPKQTAERAAADHKSRKRIKKKLIEQPLTEHQSIAQFIPRRDFAASWIN
jgi:hypothetical protein